MVMLTKVSATMTFSGAANLVRHKGQGRRVTSLTTRLHRHLGLETQSDHQNGDHEQRDDKKREVREIS